MGTLATYAYVFATGVKTKGLKATIEIILARGFEPTFILVPMGIGVLAVFIAFIGSISVPKGGRGNKNEGEGGSSG